LQREHLERLIDLSMGGGFSSASQKPISNLATAHLRDLKKQVDQVLEDEGVTPDPYSQSHLSEASIRIEKALDADYIYNASSMGGGGGFLRFMREPQD